MSSSGDNSILQKRWTKWADNISCLSFQIKVHTDKPGRTDHWVQVGRVVPDCNTHELSTMWGRKWRLSAHMTCSEFVQTVFKAMLTFEEHEIREQFNFAGRRIFDPHRSIPELVKDTATQEART